MVSAIVPRVAVVALLVSPSPIGWPFGFGPWSLVVPVLGILFLPYATLGSIGIAALFGRVDVVGWIGVFLLLLLDLRNNVSTGRLLVRIPGVLADSGAGGESL